MPTPITPKALSPGDTIALISPSARLNSRLPDVVSRAKALLESRGYKVREFFNEDQGIQSCIANRLSEIRQAFSAPDISAVICTIGGTTFTELLPSLIADTALHATIRDNPKIVIGYSDISCFHWFLHAMTGLRTFYGPGAIPELGEAPYADESTSPVTFMADHLFRVVTSREAAGEIPRSQVYNPRAPRFFVEPSSTTPTPVSNTPPWVWLRKGRGRGRLFGGCLTVIARAQGVRAIVPDWKGKIVFVETATSEDAESGNPIHRVQAALADLIAGGVFDDAAGLVVGRAYGYDSEEERRTYMDVITGLLCEGPMGEQEFPILFGVDIGHTMPMVTLPYDAMAELDSDRDSFAIVEAAVV
ncbi:LD-carboxypeptidase domain-containing protein [Sarocladium implicatum]|nr:LD-carboxypeptidase domain-containing protein [Sarocladium implicatum]